MVVSVLIAWSSVAGATEAGLDIGHVVDGGTVHDHLDAVASTGAGWVRINLRLDAWSAPDDPARHGEDQLTWFEAYDRVIDAYTARGIEVYALINDESVASQLDHDSDAWIAQYVQNAVKIIDHFKNRVRVFEIINEPNDYAGGNTARFTPRAYAKILQDTYLAVKHDAGHIDDRCWQVSLVSGPLFSFDSNDSASYLEQAYAIGKSQLAWDYTHQATGSYPLDGVGYHVYVAQGLDSSTADVRTRMAANLGAVWNVVTSYEGAATPKRLWVSEFGWQAGVVGAGVQAERMQAGFEAIRASGTTALAVYFNYQDFPGASYGVFDDAGARRTSADMLHMLADGNRAPNGAAVTGVVVPALAPGAAGEAIVTLVNRGSATWSDGVRLGAAPGCPDAADHNGVAWEPAAGYANGVLDARVVLPHAVAPGESIELHVPIRAPAQEGRYTFAARMVREGEAWFGATASATLVVANDAPGAGGSGSGSDGEPGQGGGCATTSGSSSVGFGLVWLLVRRKRRRIRE